MKRLLRSFLLSLFATAALCVQASDVSVTAAGVVASANARFQDGTAGASITAGQIVYQDNSDSGKIKLADANASAATSVVLGMAAHAASSGQPIRVIIYDPALTVGAVLSLSTPVYVLSATAGGVAPVGDLATGLYPVYLLTTLSTNGTSSSTCIFNPVRGSTVIP